MKQAIFHVGLHKTGTTFLQTCIKRSLATSDRFSHRVFFSSQHSECGDWKTLRKGAFARLRRTLSKSMQSQVDYDGLIRAVEESGLLEGELLELSTHLKRDVDVFFHSDENTIGAPFGHSFQSPVLDYPFYPGAEMIIGLLVYTAAKLYDKVTVVITFRDFGEYVESSLKDAVVSSSYTVAGRKSILLPRLNLVKRKMGVIAPRMRQIVEYVGHIPFLDHLVLVDYEILKVDPTDYLIKVAGDVFDQSIYPRIVQEKVNPSISNAEAIEAYLADQPELRGSVGISTHDDGLLSTEERFLLTQCFVQFTTWADNMQKLNPKIRLVHG